MKVINKFILILIIITLLLIILSLFIIINRNKDSTNISDRDDKDLANRDINSSPENNFPVQETTNYEKFSDDSRLTSNPDSNLGYLNNHSSDLPDDLYQRECGFYFESYKICAGFCPSGFCVQEGRSCYCKII